MVVEGLRPLLAIHLTPLRGNIFQQRTKDDADQERRDTLQPDTLQPDTPLKMDGLEFLKLIPPEIIPVAFPSDLGDSTWWAAIRH